MDDDKKKNEKEAEEKTEEKVNEDTSGESVREQKEDAKDWEEQYKRALADYRNLQRYTQQQRIIWAQQANKDIILKFLPVLDTLMLIAKHFEDKSLPLAIEQFLKILEEEGVKRIKTEGETFDPGTMECITTKDGDDGKVLEEVRAGYRLGDIIIRTAQVIAGKK